MPNVQIKESCICGYYHDMMSPKSKPFTIILVGGLGGNFNFYDYYGGTMQLVGCPKCGTVKMKGVGTIKEPPPEPVKEEPVKAEPEKGPEENKENASSEPSDQNTDGDIP